eukprot:gene10078-21003_t
MSVVVIFLAFASLALSFNFSPKLGKVLSRSAMKMALNNDVIQKLDSLKAKYDDLLTQTTPEAEEEKSLIEDTVQKYSTYKEIKLMMGKLRKMWRSEESERRQTRQLNSFISLYKGRIEIEETLKEKLGLPSNKKAAESLEGLAEVLKWDAEISALEKKVEAIEIKVTPGMSTREERFDY